MHLILTTILLAKYHIAPFLEIKQGMEKLDDLATFAPFK